LTTLPRWTLGIVVPSSLDQTQHWTGLWLARIRGRKSRGERLEPEKPRELFLDVTL
jgi:hypothetical protein